MVSIRRPAAVAATVAAILALSVTGCDGTHSSHSTPKEATGTITEKDHDAYKPSTCARWTVKKKVRTCASWTAARAEHWTITLDSDREISVSRGDYDAVNVGDHWPR